MDRLRVYKTPKPTKPNIVNEKRLGIDDLNKLLASKTAVRCEGLIYIEIELRSLLKDLYPDIGNDTEKIKEHIRQGYEVQKVSYFNENNRIIATVYK